MIGALTSPFYFSHGKLSCCPEAFMRGYYPGLLIAVALRCRYCSGATFTVAVAVAPLLLAESSGDSSAATFLATFQRYSLPLLLKKKTNFFPLLIFLRAFSRQSIDFSRR